MELVERFPAWENLRRCAGSVARGTIRPATLSIVLPMLLHANAARAALVTYDYTLDFSTQGQNTYGTGPTGAITTPSFLGFDTGPNPFFLGGVEHATIPSVDFGLFKTPPVDLGDYGAFIDGNFDLRTGFEIVTRNDSGTIDAAQSFLTSLSYDDERLAGQFTDFMTSQVSQSQWMKTTFPNVGLDVDFVLEIDNTFLNVTGCFVDCATLPLIPNTNVAVDVPIFDYNEVVNGVPDGLVKLFGFGIDEDFAAYQTDDGTVTVGGGEVTTKPSITLNLEVPFKKGLTLGYVTVEVPQPHTEATEINGDSTLQSAAEDDFIEIGIDLDTAIVAIPGAGVVLNQINSNGVTIPFTDLGIGYDLLNFNIAWDMDYSQEFTLMSNLVVDLDYSEAVLWKNSMGGYQWIDGWQGFWTDMPDFTKLEDGVVEVTPMFDLAATLRNLTELDYDLDFILELFKIWYNLGIFGEGSVALLDAEWPVDLFRTTEFDQQFALTGWNSIARDPFDVHFYEVPVAESLFCRSVTETLDYYDALAESFETSDKTLLAFLNKLFYVRENLRNAVELCNSATPVDDYCDTQLGYLQAAKELLPPDNGYVPATRLLDAASLAEITCGPRDPVTVTTVFIPEDPPTEEPEVAAVPEPPMILLLALGLGSLGFVRRRKG